MDIRSAFKHQFHAALKALRGPIETCPDSLWDAGDAHQAPVWRVAYHAIFFAHYYLQPSHANYTPPWSDHRRELVEIGRIENGARVPLAPCEPCSKQRILELWKIVEESVDACVDALDLDADPCGFPWYPMPTIEHQLVNLRHIQHHAAALSARLRATGVQTPWVGRA